METVGVAPRHQQKPFDPFRVGDGSVPDEDGTLLFHFDQVHPPCEAAPVVVDLDNDGGNNILVAFRKDQVVVPKKALRGVDMAVSRTLVRGAAAASRTCVNRDDHREEDGRDLAAAGHRQVCLCSSIHQLQVPWKIAGATGPLGWAPIRKRLAHQGCCSVVLRQ